YARVPPPPPPSSPAPPLFFLLTTPPPPTSPLFPYTTLFRSVPPRARARRSARRGKPPGGPWSLRRSRPGRDARPSPADRSERARSEEHTSELQSLTNLVCRLLLEKKKQQPICSSSLFA